MPNIAKQFYPEIQGIRAISILAVILFHFGIHIIPGGYVGVDMFFVISGYLITKMIAGELSRGSFSIVKFYRHRVIRLLPNLFVMIVVSAIISYLVLKPYDFMQYAKSLQFSAVYLTNMVFARQQGYFDMSRDAKPLLHTWSLSIEEQFYLIFPLLLILLYKLKSHRITVLVLIALASLWVRFHYVQQFLPTEGFFSFAGRVWEFVVGALVALMPVALKERYAGNEKLSLLAFMLVIGSLLFLDEGIPYAALLLVIPCFATALLIAYSAGTRPGRWLSGKALVFIGGLSYSLYLWHWPLVVWLHNADFELGRYASIALLLLLTSVISYLAWKYIEEPFRNNREKFSGRFVAAMTLSFGMFCVAVGSYVYVNEGMVNRFPSWVEVQKNLDAYDFEAATGTKVRHPACVIGDDAQETLRSCAFGDLNSDKRFLLLGDSHTYASYPAFQHVAEVSHARGVIATLAGCPPVFGVMSYDGAKDICAEHFDRRVEALIAAGGFQKVFLVAAWSVYTEGDPNNQPNHFISDTQTYSHDAESSKQVIARHLRETIRSMNQRGIEVVIVKGVPILPKVIQNLPVDFKQPLERVRQRNRFMDEFIAQWQGPGLRSVDPNAAFCDGVGCQTRINGNVLYGDDNHLSPAGAALLIPLIEPML